MSQLHPTEEDDAFASMHTEAGLAKAVAHIRRLKKLLRSLPTDAISRDQADKIETVLRMDHRDEDGERASRYAGGHETAMKNGQPTWNEYIY